MPDAPNRSPELLRSAAADFVQEFIAALDVAGRTDPALHPFAECLRSASTRELARGLVEPGRYPALSHVPVLRDQAAGTGLNTAAFDAAEVMNWLPVVEGDGIDPTLASGMFAAQAVGTYGCFDSTEIAAGLFLIAPGVTYPLHTHAASEIYWCLGGEITLQHGINGTPFILPDGIYSVTPPNRVHALVTATEPVLLAYLWIGDLTAPIWWWDEPKPGAWRRTEWRRPPGGSWHPVREEPVTPEIMAEAHP